MFKHIITALYSLLNNTVLFTRNGTTLFKFICAGISKGAAEWIVNSKKFVGVGLDTASADAGNTTAYDAHRILAESQIYILENVKLTYDLPGKQN